MYCRNCGNAVDADAAYCPACGAAQSPATARAPLATTDAVATGPEVAPPPEIRGWNWGAFLLTWIWGIGNNVYIALLGLLGFIPVIGWVIALGIAIYLGAAGNRLAWEKKRWIDVAHFKEVQRKWAIAGLIVLAVVVVFFFFVASSMEQSTTF